MSQKGLAAPRNLVSTAPLFLLSVEYFIYYIILKLKI